MKLAQPTLVAILASLAAVEAGCSQDGGNYYCSSTKKVSYTGLGYSGSYKDVTNMDEDSGKCTQKSQSFSGNLSPLDEELSVHFRGPLKLKQFGVYYPSSGSNNKREDVQEKRDEECSSTIQHAHHHHKRATAIVAVTQTVIVDGQGNTVTSQETGTTTPTQATEANTQDDTTTEASATGAGGKGFFGWGDNSSTDTETTDTETTASSSSESSSSETESESSETSAASSSSSSSSSSSGSVASGDWERVAYYTPGSTDNVTFMNYYGGSGSGVWSGSFGNSLSYANSDASGGSSSAVALKETTTKSDQEFIIFSGESCDNGDGCGYYRDGIPAKHGFGGNQKIFVFEFEMPTASDSVTNNHDMPAVWLLNAKIPRTLQYGDSTCSCWKSGCGELDAWEILSSGSDKLISHIHDGQGSDGTSNGGGGSQDYFQRPTDGSFKGAIVFDGSDVHILEVDDDFESSLSSSTVKSWINQSGSKASIGY